MSKERRINKKVLNKYGEEKPTQVMVRLFKKQKDKVAKNAHYGDRSQFVRDAIDAYKEEIPTVSEVTM